MRVNTLIPALVLALAGSASALADDDLDVTMRMVPGDEAPDESVVPRIELPESASDQAHEMAAPGLERAEEASEQGREASEQGREAAEAARERGRDARDRAQERGQIPEAGEPVGGRPGGGAGGGPTEVPSGD